MDKKIIIGSLVVVLILAGLILFTQNKNTEEVSTLGSASSGFVAYFATTSTIQAGPQQALVWYSGKNGLAATDCTARIISTQGRDVALNFGISSSTATSTLSLTLSSGFVQLASTTVVYESEFWGCGVIGIKGYGATSTVTISETR